MLPVSKKHGWRIRKHMAGGIRNAVPVPAISSPGYRMSSPPFIDLLRPLYYIDFMYHATFDEFCIYADSLNNLEQSTGTYSPREYRLDRMAAILVHLGNPHLGYETIHLAGSKGKGSTALMIARAVQAAGEKTGLYMSPHLTDYRERFTLSGEFFDERTLVEASNAFRSSMEDFAFSDEYGVSYVTTFEIYTSFAFFLFRFAGCTAAVIETGLGGRLDATNVVLPSLSIITPIELEHTAILGSTIEKIALEKAKIIKQGIPVLISRQSPEAKRVIENEAAENHSHLWDITLEVESISTHTSNEGESVSIEWKNGERTRLLLQMRGEVQGENAALAIQALRLTGYYRPGVSERAIETAALPGRMTLISEEPPLVIDGAHTSESMRHLLNSFTQWFPAPPRTIIFGALEDKDILHMARLIVPMFAHIIISRPGTFKKSDIASTFRLFQEEITRQNASSSLYMEAEAADALSLAFSLSTGQSPILCTGSFYLGGVILEAHDELRQDREQLV